MAMVAPHLVPRIRHLSLYADRYPDEYIYVYDTRSLVLGPEPQLDGVPFKKLRNLRVLEIGSNGLENSHLMDIYRLIGLRCLSQVGINHRAPTGDRETAESGDPGREKNKYYQTTHENSEITALRDSEYM